MEDTAGFVPIAPRATSVSSLLDRLFDPVFSLYVFATIFLPTGSLYGVNLKSPLYLLLLPLAVRRYFRSNPTNVAMLGMMLVIPAFLSFWVLEGIVHGFPASGAIRQYMDILLVLLMCWLSFLFCQNRESRRLRFLLLILNCEVATCFFKAGIIFYALARGVSVVSVVSAVSQAFSTDLMTMDIGEAFGRVQFVSDALIPICLFIVLRYRERLGLGYTRSVASILLLLVSVAFSFSRYFWGYSAVALVVGLLLAKRDRFKVALIASLAIATLISLPTLADLYALRFSEAIAGSSDSLRVEQKEALQRFFLDAPIAGHGWGSYTTVLVRNADGKHSYEMQLFALTGQIGILGMTFFVILLAWYYRRIFFRGPASLADRLGLGTLLISWLAAGLYNPLLESAAVSVAYASLAAMSALERTDPTTLASGQVHPDTT